MSLLTLLYHRIGHGKYANEHHIFKEHLLFIKDKYPILLPGDPIPSKTMSVCLTFDDATFDFYHYVFPLLVAFNLRAILGVPTRYIKEKTSLSSDKRLSVPYPLMMQDGIFEEKVPFCTWQEIEEMVKSGHVEVASHSFSHPNLSFPFVNLEREVLLSKKMLEERLPQAISSFIYPFGKANLQAHNYVKKHYAYAFRIGSAFNKSWNKAGPLCRVPADSLSRVDAPFSFLKKLSYSAKAFFEEGYASSA